MTKYDTEPKWMPVVGYEDCYEISDTGVLRSLTRKIKCRAGGTRVIEGKVINVRPNKHGYVFVGLSKNRRYRNQSIHRIVMMAFSPHPDCERLEVNHINGDKCDNALSNLEWCTHAENTQHSFNSLGRRSGRLGKSGIQDKRSKPVRACNSTTGETNYFESIGLASQFINGTRSAIIDCLKGRRKSHKGYSWSYA